jgi:hypothetical protein
MKAGFSIGLSIIFWTTLVGSPTQAGFLDKLKKGVEDATKGVGEQLQNQQPAPKTQPKSQKNSPPKTTDTRGKNSSGSAMKFLEEYCAEIKPPLGPKLFSQHFGGDSLFDVACRLEEKKKNGNPELNWRLDMSYRGDGWDPSRPVEIVHLEKLGDFGPLNGKPMDDDAVPKIVVKNFELGGNTFNVVYSFHTAWSSRLKGYGFAWARLKRGQELSPIFFRKSLLSEHLNEISIESDSYRLSPTERTLWSEDMEQIRELLIGSLKKQNYNIKADRELITAYLGSKKKKYIYVRSRKESDSMFITFEYTAENDPSSEIQKILQFSSNAIRQSRSKKKGKVSTFD